ncbi:MAG: PH domain-containing protein [Patescibacteria group bacterium]
MFIENQIPNRQKDEKLILFLRRHIIVLLGKWLMYLFLALVPVAIYFFLQNFQPWILNNKNIYPFLFLLTSVYYLYTAMFLFSSFIDYYLDVWIVTDQRIINIEQRGLFNREIAEQDLDRIQDVSGSQKGVLQTFFKFGDVHIQTAGEVQKFIFRQVPKPFEIVRIINTFLEKQDKKFEHQLAEKIKPQE